MPKEKETKEEPKKEETNQKNVVLAKFKKDQTKENKDKRWRVVEDAVHAARKAYTGGFEAEEDEKTVSFETAVKDLAEVLQKVLNGEIKLGGLGEDQDKVEISEPTTEG